MFKKDEFNKYEYYKDIFEQLNLESINIDVIILNQIFSKELDISQNKISEQYKINENSKEGQKVKNFYEILFKFILKNSCFLYNIPFLEDNFKRLIEFYSKIHNKLYKEQRIINILKENQKKLRYLKESIKSFEKISIQEDQDLNQSNPNNSKQYSTELNQSKSSNQSVYENIQNSSKIENKKIDVNVAKEILTNVKIEIKIEVDEIVKNIEIKKICKYGNNIRKKMDNDFLCKDYNYEDIKEGTMEEKIIYKKYKQFLDYLDEIEEYILKSKIYFNPVIILDLKKKKLKSGDFDMNCVYSFERQSSNKTELIFRDNNILANGINGRNIGFVLLINELSEIEYKGIEYKENNDF